MNPHSWAKILLLALPLTILTACTSTPRVDSTFKQSEAKPTQTADINTLLIRATRAREPERSRLYLQAADYFKSSNISRAADLLDLIDQTSFNRQQQDQFLLTQVWVQLENNTAETAHQWLNAINRNTLLATHQYEFDTLSARLADLEGRYGDAILNWNLAANNPAIPATPVLYQQLWTSILQEDSEELSFLLATNQETSLQPWLELAQIYRSPNELALQLADLKRWQTRWNGTAAQRNTPAAIVTLQETPPYQPKLIALLLPLTGPQASAGQAVRDGFMAGYYQALKNSSQNPQSSRQLPEIVFYDTEGTQNPAELARRAQDEGAEMLIGPLRRSIASRSLTSHDVNIPWLILNQVSEPVNQPSVYQFGLASELEASQAAERAWQDGYRNPIVMTPDSSWGTRISESFSQIWEELGGKVLSQYTFNNKGDYNTAASEALLVNESFKRANSLTRLLGERLDYTPRRREDVDMIFIAGSPTQGRQLKPALDFYFAYNLPVYTISTMYNGQVDPVQNRDLNDVRIPLMPWLAGQSSPLKESIQNTWQESKGPLTPLYALGSDAWRIYPRLEQMAKSEGAQLFGATGTLTIPPSKEVKRELSWQYFRNGHPAPLSREMSLHPERSQNVLENES
ncbi:penicillin-binding protein activator [Parendozoicomonas sp. Alg238-R29]|uniref:penicillin-binding protein activator n=1 Tax=Parendozoicomonas sp. Alg238-R29 TaxID=2993446 RepID=UPI00248E07DC|nr:penicillin-binding protein activator [Parendozoicomonas sp. Alg238-R29]